MPSVLDVAAYILNKCGPMTAMKLQKLVYYSQAWSLVWDEEPLFDEEVEAWANGPVVWTLYNAHRGQYQIGEIPGGNLRNLTADQINTIDSVVKFYGDKPAQWLSDLTHMEDPWKFARQGLPDGERSGRVIPKAHMAEYYGSL
jgi:uncharacterized phage-associated protein